MKSTTLWPPERRMMFIGGHGGDSDQRKAQGSKIIVGVELPLGHEGYAILEVDCKPDSSKEGYHQVKMARSNEDKTTIYTEKWRFYYTKMPIVLRNRQIGSHVVTTSRIEENLEKVESLLRIGAP
uniref:Uncharacterized protein n=1 Tax=Lactuca sativa TaxID=4236 RepID=A0A9R1XAG9_LACSA|nr:hypothetical protein LSAT_V11C500259310 [Lactuca sativa]